MSKFEAQTDFNEKHATADVFFKAGPGGFPVELSLNYHSLFPVPAIQFEENPEGISELFNQKINIFVSPT